MTSPRTPSESELAQPGVPPDIYDDDYFLTNCNGFQQYVDSHGRDPAPRLKRAMELSAVQAGESVLDVGCGRGELLVQCALRGADATGIDYAEAAVRLAREAVDALDAALSGSVTVRQMDARRLGFPDGTFDAVFMTDVIEHLYPAELDQVMAEVRRVLKPSGRVLIHTAPNRLMYVTMWRLYIRHVHRAAKLAAAVARVGDAGYRNLVFPTGKEPPRSQYELRMHVNEHAPGDVKRLLRRHRFTILRMDYHDPDRRFLKRSRRVRLLDAVRFLEPLSNHRPLSKLFSNHIWVLARPKP
jgi:ubiquinone/menaquinone biosynthesis C-methylase UbiE